MHPGVSSGDESAGRRASLCIARIVTSPQPGRLRNLRAFTLTELMVVIVLIGVMTIVIVPEMRGTFDDALLRSTSRDLLSVFNVAYSQSVSRNQSHRVRLDTVGGRYLLERSVRIGFEEAHMPARDVPGASGKLDERITIRVLQPGEPLMDPSADGATDWSEPATGETLDAITFHPDGTADAAQVALRDRNGFRLALRINPVTARVRVIDLPRE